MWKNFEHQCKLLEVPNTGWTCHMVGLLDEGAAIE